MDVNLTFLSFGVVVSIAILHSSWTYKQIIDDNLKAILLQCENRFPVIVHGLIT